MAGNGGNNWQTGAWQGWSSQTCHPDAPAGGGGMGRFRMASPLDAWRSPVPDYTQLLQLRTAGGVCKADTSSSLPHPAAPASRTLPAGTVPGDKADASFGIGDIPNVMRKQLGWPMSAAVMEKWFAGAKRVMTKSEKTGAVPASDYPSAYVDTTLFTMAWLRKFERVTKAYSTLLGSLSTPNAKLKLARIAAALPEGASPADAPGVLALHTRLQFQYVSVGYQGDLDDLYGSLGNFALYAAVLEWKVTRPAGGKSGGVLDISKVGIYMRDTFEFLDAQYLGHWSHKGMGIVIGAAVAGKLADAADIDVGREWHLKGWNPQLGWTIPINNSDFTAWQTANNRGGDLMLFSDVIVEPVKLSIPFSSSL